MGDGSRNRVELALQAQQAIRSGTMPLSKMFRKLAETLGVPEELVG